MGGIQCAKTIIDNRAAAKQKREQRLTILDRQLDCMGTSILLSAGRKDNPVFPTEEMETEFVNATAEFNLAVATAAEKLAGVSAVIAAHCDPTRASTTSGT